MTNTYSRPFGRIWILFLCNTTLLVVGQQWATAQQDPGYRLEADRIVIDRPSHWRNWSLPSHAVDLSSAGRVTPHRFRRRYNLLDDRLTFQRKLKEFEPGKNQSPILNIDSTEALDIRGNVLTQKVKGQQVPVYSHMVHMGISRVGSNARAAANILDGDRSTYWEPDPADPLDDWWIEVDLGRVVVVDSLVLRFVEAERGDPFRQFRVLAAPDQEPVLEAASKVSFDLLAQTMAPTREQREFSFVLEQRQVSPEWTGRMVETIRLVVTDSKRGRGARISEAEWEALDSVDRGDIVYFVKALEGFEEPEQREVYESLPAERRGRREYYIRERPRLVDIEVWGFGDNIGLSMVEGGGNLQLTGGGFSPGAGFDGDYSTNFVHAIRKKTAIVDRGVLTIDMGATFWLDAMRISSTRTSTDGYLVRHSDGTRDISGELKWTRLSSREREDNSVDLFEHFLDSYPSPSRLRFLEMTSLSASPRGIYYQGPQIIEYQLFSEGYPAAVVLTSDLIEMPAGRSLGPIRWQADTPPGTALDIRSRSGSLRRKVVRYFDKSGSEITQKQWNNLLGSFKGPIDTAFVAGSDWSNWSRSYQRPGELVTSPSQDFLQLQVQLRTDDRTAAASIQSIDIEFLEPVAERLVAELWPLAVEVPGRLDTFEVFVRPFFVENPTAVRSAGFDELRLRLPGRHRPQLLELAVGVDERTAAAVQVFSPTPDGDFADPAGQPLQVLKTQDDAIYLRLPQVLHALPTGQRTYYRRTAEREQIPVDYNRQLLTAASYGQLEPGERGERQYFRRESAASGQRLVRIDEATYDGLANDERTTRYFRILVDEGGQFPFDAAGDSLDQSSYDMLAAAERGRIVGQGPLLRLRFAAAVFVNGATVELAVRRGGSDKPEAFWQDIPPGDATSLAAGDALSIQVPHQVKPLGDFAIAPNPFTPNGDGINDAAEIRFSVFKLGAARAVQVSIYRLDGRRYWQQRQIVASGQISFRWPGTDAQDRIAPPGIYICQVSLEVDAEDAGATLSRLIHVAY